MTQYLPPRRTFEDQANAEPLGDLCIGAEVLVQGRFAFRRAQQVEGGEVRQLQAFVEDQGRFDAAIGQEQTAGQLRQRVAVVRYAFFPPAFSVTCRPLTWFAHHRNNRWRIRHLDAAERLKSAPRV